MTHWITSWFKLWVWGTVTSWFCRHDYKWYRNVYGDEINHVDWRTDASSAVRSVAFHS